jgi:Proteasome subunit
MSRMLILTSNGLPNAPPKPYIRPAIKGAKKMTIAAGFRCSDGIVLCADSQMTATDGTKYNAQKIFSYSKNQVDAVFAFAGMEVFSKMCIERLAACILASNFDSVEQVLQTEAFNIHEAYAPRATVHATDYDLDILVGVRFTSGIRDGIALYHIEGPAVSPPIKTFDCLGIGRTVARQAIGLFLGDSLTVQEASRIGVYCLKQTKDHVDACGGPSQVLMLWDADDFLGYDPPYNVEQDYILEIERGFSVLFESLRPVFLNFNNTLSFESNFTKHLEDAAKTIKKVWNTTYGSIVRQEKRNQEELRRFMEDLNKPKDI